LRLYLASVAVPEQAKCRFRDRLPGFETDFETMAGSRRPIGLATAPPAG
jgi:hypothetical protein